VEVATLRGKVPVGLVAAMGFAALIVAGPGLAGRPQQTKGSLGAEGPATPSPSENQIGVLPSPSPIARVYHSMAYDGVSQQIVLFGGNAQPSFDATHRWLNDTWLWSGTSWTAAAPPVAPAPRGAAAMAYDEGSSQLILFGGWTTDGKPPASNDRLLNDTWVWSGQSWTVIPAAHAPSPRANASLEYDPNSRKLVLFGGSGESGLLSDTWTWNGDDWAEVTNQAVTPPVGARLGLVGKPGEIVSLGSCAIGARARFPLTLLNEAWNLGPSMPTQLITLCGSTVVSNPETGEALIFGGGASFPDGVNSGPTSERTGGFYSWNGTAMSDNSSSVGPAPRTLSAGTYDRARHVTLFFGGDAGAAGHVLGDTWIWDGKSWHEAK
jgi:hypothetical protein